jgi:hypothetical protein
MAVQRFGMIGKAPAEQMSDAEIGCAQRAARGWLKAHPQEPAAPRICAAA